jgi:hypothetical protein
MTLGNIMDAYLLILFTLLTFFSSSIYADHFFCESKSLHDILKNNESIKYIDCFNVTPFEYAKLPLATDHYLHPNKGLFEKTFILQIPQGQVFGLDGWVLANGMAIHELIWLNVFPPKQLLEKVNENKPVYIKGRVAVIAQTGYTYYYHWIAEVLGRLALLELNGIEYDFLYVPTNRPYMKETLTLFGVDPAKIIEATDNFIFSADELIVPSLVAKVKTDGCPRLVHYLPKNITIYIKEKLLLGLETQKTQPCEFSKKIFISRKDAQTRKMLNEDDVFAIFEEKGFKRYVLSNMSIKDQILLFKNAEIIVGALGSGLTNVIFCNDKVRIFEIFLARRDCTIYNLCQNLGLNYQPIKTVDFIDQNDGQFNATVPLDIFKNLTSTF